MTRAELQRANGEIPIRRSAAVDMKFQPFVAEFDQFKLELEEVSPDIAV